MGERTKTVRESRRLFLIHLSQIRTPRCIRRDGIEEWDECDGESQKVTSVAHEDEKRKRISEQEFAYSSQNEQTASEGERSSHTCLCSSPRASPAHELCTEGCQSGGEAHDGQGCGIGKAFERSGSDVARREEETFELLVGDALACQPGCSESRWLAIDPFRPRSIHLVAGWEGKETLTFDEDRPCRSAG